MQTIIVTGMSGAGKTTVLKILEDLGYYCVDNLPPQLIPRFTEVCLTNRDIEKVGLGLDIRGGKLFADLLPALGEMDSAGIPYTVIFLDSSDEVLVKRFKETRRSHPLAKDDRLIEGILRERGLLAAVKGKATYIIDTSHTLTRELRETVTEIIGGQTKFESLMITVMSFGFKHGIPTDSDLMFDVRFIPNPFYYPELRNLTGFDPSVRDLVMSWEITGEFLDRTISLLKFLIPNYINEGKNQLVISIGCTGGKHRSVTIANEIFRALSELGFSVNVRHRDYLLSN